MTTTILTAHLQRRRKQQPSKVKRDSGLRLLTATITLTQKQTATQQPERRVPDNPKEPEQPKSVPEKTKEY
jgi:hypothetical protein